MLRNFRNFRHIHLHRRFSPHNRGHTCSCPLRIGSPPSTPRTRSHIRHPHSSSRSSWECIEDPPHTGRPHRNCPQHSLHRFPRIHPPHRFSQCSSGCSRNHWSTGRPNTSSRPDRFHTLRRSHRVHRSSLRNSGCTPEPLRTGRRYTIVPRGNFRSSRHTRRLRTASQHNSVCRIHISRNRCRHTPRGTFRSFHHTRRVRIVLQNIPDSRRRRLRLRRPLPRDTSHNSRRSHHPRRQPPHKRVNRLLHCPDYRAGLPHRLDSNSSLRPPRQRIPLLPLQSPESRLLPIPRSGKIGPADPTLPRRLRFLPGFQEKIPPGHSPQTPTTTSTHGNKQECGFSFPNDERKNRFFQSEIPLPDLSTAIETCFRPLRAK